VHCARNKRISALRQQQAHYARKFITPATSAFRPQQVHYARNKRIKPATSALRPPSFVRCSRTMHTQARAECAEQAELAELAELAECAE
jgi:hypothetical protein